MASLSRRPASTSGRAFRAMLRLYPAAFRDEYGRELSLVFADRYRDASGRLARARLWLEAAAGIAADAPREHARLAAEDLRHAVRRLRANPGVAATSILTLALAMAASSTMYSVVEGVLLKPLPVAAPEQLVVVWTGDPSRGGREERSAYGTADAWQRESRSFVALAAFDPVSSTLASDGRTDQVSVARASPELLGTLGLTPVAGRWFSASEANHRQRVALISHRFWQSRFGGAADAVGAGLELNGQLSRVIGVLPDALRQAGFDADVWEAQTLFPDWESRQTQLGAGSWFVVGRLREGVSLAQAKADLAAIADRIDQQLPAAARQRGVSVVPLARYVIDVQVRTHLWLLFAAATCLLLAAAANVAGIALARSIDRVPELAIRAALGASRTRIVRQLIVEGLTLAAAAGVVGLILSVAAIRGVRLFGPQTVARLQEVSLDPRVLAWTLAACLVTGVLIGLVPAATLWRRDLRAADAAGGRRSAGRAASRLRRVLVVAQCAVAIVLLSGAGLLVRSWWRVLQVDPGFRSEDLLAVSVASPPGIEAAGRAPFYDRVLAEVSALPGVVGAGAGSELLVTSVAETAVTVGGPDRPVIRLPLRRDEASPGYFSALGTRIVSGRGFAGGDGQAGAPVVLVNETMARRVWAEGNPVGSRITVGPPTPQPIWYTVVGVVADMRRQGPETAPVAQMFEPLAQNAPRRAVLVVRVASGDPVALTGSIRAAVQRIDRGAAVYDIATVDARLERLTAPRRLQTWLLAAFALAALSLAGLGIYGLGHYSVSARTHEIGLRMALGAGGADIFRMIMGEGLALCGVGLGIGLAGSLWLGQAASTLLFGVTPTDPVTFLGVPLLTVLVTAGACYLPARRAMRVAPTEALRHRVG